MNIKIKRLHKDAVIPSYGHPGDVGLDLHSLEDYELQPGEKYLFMNGFALEFPEGYGAIVMDKGSVSMKGLKVLGGVFDAGYRGEYNVCLINLSQEVFKISKGQKLAQLVTVPVMCASLEEVDELNEGARGKSRFGSTGTH